MKSAENVYRWKEKHGDISGQIKNHTVPGIDRPTELVTDLTKKYQLHISI